MDGLLAETESLWRMAQRKVAQGLGLSLSDADMQATMGQRIDAVVDIWRARKPWGAEPSTPAAAQQVVDEVIALSREIKPMPGVMGVLELADREGVRLALCSSSSMTLITHVTDRLGIRDRFEVIHSAGDDAFGKPHPAPYLATAAKLGVAVGECLAFEDSKAGGLSAASAGMTVVAVPDPSSRGSAKFGFADAVLGSLEQFSLELVTRLASGTALSNMSRPRFHLAFPVRDLAEARQFYGELLECPEGRSSDTWVDFDLFGHQIVAHLELTVEAPTHTNPVDGEAVPARHFGALLSIDAWDTLVQRLSDEGQSFLIEPQIRFEGLPGEQRTFFVTDPSGNALEFKAFADDTLVFRKTAP